MMLAICGAFAVLLAWSYFSWVDIYATAVGKIQPSGRSKVVQPLEPGRIVDIRIENGATVAVGDVMLELDPTDTTADKEALEKDLEAANAEIGRRRAAIAAALEPTLRPGAIAFIGDVSAATRRREESVLAADLGQLRSAAASLRAQRAEKEATLARLRSSIESRQRLLSLSKERVEMRQSLETSGAGSRAMIIESMQQYETQVNADIGDRGQLIETQAGIAYLDSKMEEAITQFTADQTQKLAEAEKKRDRQLQELVKAKSKNDRTQLKAPIAGIVQQLGVTTVGQVVASGQSLLTVVPLDGPIEIEALITNKDIGFVQAGQRAIVKVDAFPFTKYGTIDATVVKVSRDAVEQRNATTMSDVATASRQQSGLQSQSGGGDNLVFPATIKLDARTILVDGKDVPLMSGMSVSVEIKTGERRAIDFVLSPLREVVARTAHER